MRYFREQGKNDHEVMEALEAKFGDTYQIMTRKTVKLGGIFGVGRRTGVEYYGYIKEKISSLNNIEQEAGKKQKKSVKSGQIPKQGNQAALDEKSRDEILARFVKNKEVQRWLQETKLNNELRDTATALPQAPEFVAVENTPSPVAPPPAAPVSPVGGAGVWEKTPHTLEREESMLLQRLESLERRVENREPSSLAEFRKSLYHNEFPPFFADHLIAQIRRELPLESLEKMEQLWEHVLLDIAQNMRFVDQRPHSRIMVLVGPTGVGKTTTIAKLAARQCVEAMGGNKRIHLITLDNYRIGAQDQIRTYGEILGAKVDCVETKEGLANCIEQDQESDMILIDTMGRSPSDHIKLAEMRQFLSSSGDCEIHLTMSATSGVSAMKEIITQFKPFGFCSVILTKLDELGRIGAVLATFLQEDVPLSYLTTGQKVPQDICPASPLVLFRQLVDVELNWQSLEQKLKENMA